MSVAELEELEEVKGLIARGRQVGVLTHAEVATATAELSLEEPDVEELHGLLERCEIELVEEIDPSHRGEPEDRARARAAHSPRGCGRSQAGGDHRRSAAVSQGASARGGC